MRKGGGRWIFRRIEERNKEKTLFRRVLARVEEGRGYFKAKTKKR